MNETSAQHVNEVPVQRVNEMPVQHISETPVQHVSEMPVQHVNEMPVQHMNETPINETPIPSGTQHKPAPEYDSPRQREEKSGRRILTAQIDGVNYTAEMF